MKKLIDHENETITFAGESGHRRTFNLRDLPEPMVRYTLMNGISQKLGDCYAGKAKKSLEAGISEEEYAWQELDRVWSNLLNCVWNAAGGASGPTKLALAVAKVSGEDIAKVTARLDDLTKDEVKAIRAMPAIKAALAAIDLERAQARAKAAGQGGDEDADQVMDILGL